MQQRKSNRIYLLIAVIFWIFLWQMISMRLNETLYLPSPFQVLHSLFVLAKTSNFWVTIAYSVIKIGGGFLLAIVVGVLLALVTWKFRLLKEIILLAMRVIKSVPVVSFIILALVWVKAKNLSVLISFLMVLPIIYTNVITGIDTTNPKLLEMAFVFRMSPIKKMRYIYLPSVIPHFVSACSISLGLCWKSGIAAEVIGFVDHSIGGELYNAKLYLNIPELFAWTIVIAIISAICERFVMKGIGLLMKSEDRNN